MNESRYEYRGWSIEVYYIGICFGWSGHAMKGHLTIETREAESERHALSRLKREIDKGGPYKVGFSSRNT